MLIHDQNAPHSAPETRPASDDPISGHLKIVFEGAPYGLLVADARGRLVLVNERAETLFGYGRAELIGCSVDVLLPARLRDQHKGERASYARAPSVRHMGEGRDLVGRRKNGEEFPVEVGLSPVRIGDENLVIAALIDITKRKAVEADLARLTKELAQANASLQVLATQDPLTGLLNRRGLEGRLSLEIGRAARTGSPLVVIFADCDDFKSVNDLLGHAAGDAVLTAIARTLRAVVRPSDAVARVGGDEFLVVLPETRLAEGLHVAEKMRHAVSLLPFPDSMQAAGATVSLGVAEVPASARSVEDVIRVADDSLRSSKGLGKNRATGGLGGELASSAGLTGGDIAGAIEVAAQSVVRLADDAVVGCELVTRYRTRPHERPTDLLAPTAGFERMTSLDIDCIRLAVEHARHLDGAQRVHINILPSTVLRLAPDELASVLRAGGTTRRFCLDLSEGAFVGDPAEIREHVMALKRAGAEIALDRVGFGRSALEALLLLEPEFVKIHPRFVRGVSGDVGKTRNLARFLNVTRALGAAMVALGVETREDLATLRSLGVDLGQGALWGAPTAG